MSDKTKKLLTSGALSFALPFYFFIFGFSNLFNSNKSGFNFFFSDILWPLSTVFFAVFAALFALLALTRGKAHEISVCSVLGLLLCFYIQSSFLNQDLGELDGKVQSWRGDVIVINVVIWLVVLALPFLVRWFFEKFQRPFSIIVSSVLIVLSAVQTILGFAGGMKTEGDFAFNKVPAEERQHYLSVDGLYDVSENNNIIVFLVDKMDALYTDELLKTNPSVFDGLEGFTYYDNNVARYGHTFPSVPAMLTGEDYDFNSKTPVQYLTEAWEKAGKGFWSDMRGAGFQIGMYLDFSSSFVDEGDLSGIADNAKKVTGNQRKADSMGIFKKMSSIAAFQFMPYALKGPFLQTNTDFSTYISLNTTGDGGKRWQLDDLNLHDGLQSSGLMKTDKNVFNFIHLHGSHEPIYYNEDLERNAKRITVLDQTAGVVRIISEWAGKIKEMSPEIYEKSTIIILGDHGDIGNGQSTGLKQAVRTALFIKPAGVREGEMKVNSEQMSNGGFMGYVADAANLEGDYGPSFGDFKDNRTVFNFVRSTVFSRNTFEVFKVGPDSSSFSNWKLEEKLDAKHNF